MKPRPPDVPSGTRERLLDTAERLFADRGFAATSVRDITDAAGANLGAVNYYFRSKENLYAEVFIRRVGILREPIVAAAREAAGCAHADPHRAFRTLGRAFLAPYEDQTSSLSLLNLFAREAVESCLPPRLFTEEFFLPAIAAIIDIVRKVRPDLPDELARACAHAFFAQLVHIAKGIRLPVARPVDERLEQAVRFTVAGVLHLDRAAIRPPRGKASRHAS
jgi:TetR/AcrR family transcriptional regulator, regulator of cefoperazone and chloramphenicol sensitivity